MTTTRTRAVRRTVIAIVAVAALVVASGLLLRTIRPDTTETVETAPALRVEVAERADLTNVVALDGTVESSATLTVVHRIEGATPTASTNAQQPTGAALPTAATQNGPQGLTHGRSTTVEASLYLRTAPPEPTDDDGTVPTTEPPATTAPDQSAPSTSTPPTNPTDGCDTTTTTTAPDEPASTVQTIQPPAASVACPEPTEPTEPSTTTTTSPGGAPGGGRPSGIPGGMPSGAPTGAASGAGGTSPDAATTSVTERVTSLPHLGATIEPGDVLYSVDGSPVVAMTGELPQWRSLDSNSDDGVDIVQLETSLLALGYDDEGGLVVDSEWDNHTTRAVEAWQQGLGLEPTGEIALGDIVFLPEAPATITAVHTAVGDNVTEQDTILDVSGTAQLVVAAVTDDVAAVVQVGLAVQLDAGGDAPTDATITLMRSVTTEEGTIGSEVVITPNGGNTAQTAGSSVDVLVNVPAAASGKVTVPAGALASRLDGSYAVQVRDSAGDHWVPVEVLEIQGSRVAVSGIDDGAQVLVPA